MASCWIALIKVWNTCLCNMTHLCYNETDMRECLTKAVLLKFDPRNTDKTGSVTSVVSTVIRWGLWNATHTTTCSASENLSPNIEHSQSQKNAFEELINCSLGQHRLHIPIKKQKQKTNKHKKHKNSLSGLLNVDYIVHYRYK